MLHHGFVTSSQAQMQAQAVLVLLLPQQLLLQLPQTNILCGWRWSRLKKLLTKEKYR
jgi:hypothetical protein